MNPTGRQLAKHFEENVALVERVSTAWGEVSRRANVCRERVEAQLAEVLTALAEAYLQELTPAACGDVADRAGFKRLVQRDPLQAMAHEAERLRRRIAAIEADERHRRRQWLVGPHGELTRAVDEARGLLAPWEEACARYESLESFTDLLNQGYDTPAYQVSWLEPRYWVNWAAGDRICRELGLADFGDDVLPAWREVEAERTRWRTQVNLAEQRVDAVHELVRERDEAEVRLRDLPTIYLREARTALAGFLRMADVQLLHRWNAGHPRPEPTIGTLLPRLGGLRAKLDALDDLVDRGVNPLLHDLGARQHKYRRKIQKFSRPKHASRRHPADQQDLVFATKAERHLARAASTESLLEKLERYDRYDRFDVAGNAPELWFVEMVGRAPGPLLPELRSWYERHPDQVPAHVRDDGSVGRVAVAFHGREDRGYVS